MEKPHQFKLPKLALMAALCGGVIGAQHIQAQSADALLDKLVEKGVLSSDEANGLRDESDKGFTTAFAAKSGMPEWVTALKINGDFRGRYEGFYSPNAAFIDRNRFRYRLRVGFVANLTDDFEVGFRLSSDEPASGSTTGGDPLSGNTTFAGNAAKKFVYIDLAYGKWNPIHNADWNATSTIGKMENPFVFPSTMLFDKDYTPEGFAQEVAYNISDSQHLKWTGGGFVINEVGGSSNDPYLLATQLRLDSVWSKKLTSSVGVGWFAVLANNTAPGVSSISTAALPNGQLGNTRDAAGNPTAKFNPIYADASATYTLESAPFYPGAFPVTVSGDFLHNPATTTKNDGYTVGVTLGKAGKKGTWELSYRYEELQADVWFEEFTESDFGAFYEGTPQGGGKSGYGAGTNVRGHIIKASYSPYDSLTLSVTLYITKLIDEVPALGANHIDSNSEMNRLQVDAVWKF